MPALAQRCPTRQHNFFTGRVELVEANNRGMRVLHWHCDPNTSCKIAHLSLLNPMVSKTFAWRALGPTMTSLETATLS
eukprot:2175019-Lingulodinium_polyedra.AAC.1